MNTILKSKFRLIAWGFTIQLLLTCLLLIVYFGCIDNRDGLGTIKTVAVVTMVGSLIGTLLCVAGSFSMVGDLKAHKIPASGAIMLCVAFSITFVIGLVNKGSTLFCFDIDWNEDLLSIDVKTIMIAIFSLVSGVLFIAGLTKLSRFVSGLRIARIGYYLLLIAALVITICVLIVLDMVADVPTYYRYHYEAPAFLVILLFFSLLLMTAGLIMPLIGWWASVVGAAKIDAYNGEAELLVTAKTHTLSYSSTPKMEVLRESLRQLNDQQLKYVVDNPSGYQPAYVAEARLMLVKRQQWENLQMLTDEKLLEMVNNGTTGGYTIEQCDVASMILFTRKSPLFTSQLSRLSQPQLRAIVNNPGDYYEGHIAQAKELLK